MRRIERALDAQNAAFGGDAWHGAPLEEILGGVSDPTARPFAGAHSIAEIVAHITAVIDLVRRRLCGEDADVEQWPDVSSVSWPEALDRLGAAQNKLQSAIARLVPDDLDRTVVGKSYTVEHMLDGLLQHHAYHAGQIALINKWVNCAR